MGTGDVALDATCDYGHDSDIEWCEFDAEGVAVAVEGGFGSVINGAEDVGHYASAEREGQ